MELFDILFGLTTPIYCLSVHLFMLSNNTKSPSQNCSLGLYGGFTLLLLVCQFLKIVPLGILILNITVVFFLSKFYYSTLGQQFLKSMTTIAVLILSEAIVSVLTDFMVISLYSPTKFRSDLGIVLVRLITFLFSYLDWKLGQRKAQEYTLPQKYYIFNALVLLGVIILYIRSLLYAKISPFYFISSTIIFFSVILLVLYTNEKLYHSVVVQAKQKILEQENLALLNQQELVEQSLTSLSSLRHDMKNQLLTLAYLQKTQKSHEVTQLTQKLIEEIEHSRPLVQSNHFVVDSILNFKLAQLDKESTNLQINVKIPSTLPILAYDLTIVLGNLMDNALTALSEATKNKQLSISITVSCGMLILLIENSFDGNLKVQNGKYLSSKTFSANHGFGLDNVEKVVLRLQGVMDIESTSDTFSVQITIPLP